MVLALKRELFSPAANDPVMGTAEASALSNREHEIMELVAKGKINKQIADILGITPNTAKNHVQRILKKLGAKNRTEAANLYTPPQVEIYRKGRR